MRRSLLLLFLALAGPYSTLGQQPPEVNYEAIVSQADCVYESPAKSPVEGQPIGNGRMGTMVWTSPEAVHFQINRNDVFAVNRDHAGAQYGPTDYCGGCASVVVDVGGTPLAASQNFRQRLSLYDADLPAVLASYYAAFSPLPNGMGLFEGPTAPSVEHPALLTTTLQDALIQSVSPRPGEPEIIRVFPAWPKQWQASFRLLVRGGFLVSCSVGEGEVTSLEIQSRRGEPCRLRNPWGRPCDIIETDGNVQVLSGDVLRFDTSPGEIYRIIPHAT